MELREIALAITTSEPIAEPLRWCLDERYSNLIKFVYHGGIWNRSYRETIGEIRQKKINTLTTSEIYTYLTFIYATDRTNDGCVEAHIRNGVIRSLLERYLELESSKEEESD